MSVVRAASCAVVASAIGLLLAVRPPPEAGRRSVLVLMLDTLRADHLGVYGYPRDTSPALDRFARENLAAARAITAAPWTPPSVASMFTGLYPATHGWMPPDMRWKLVGKAVRLDDRLVTLAEIFRANGFSTAAISPNPWITAEFGFQQGFDTFEEKPEAPAGEIVAAGKAAIDALVAKRRPFFVYLHFLDPHAPYDPPAAWRGAFRGPVAGREVVARERRNIDLYDGEIRYLDGQIGDLFAWLGRRGLGDDLTIIVVGDHGEQFMERGQHGHGFQLFDEEVHVPFLVRSPRARGPRVVDRTVSTVDLFPTALDAAGLERPPGLPGVSLFDDAAVAARPGVLSTIRRKQSDQRAFTDGDGVKIIRQRDGRDADVVVGVFDAREDPGERHAIDDPALVAGLDRALAGAERAALAGRLPDAGVPAAPMKGATVEQLRALGYLQ